MKITLLGKPVSVNQLYRGRRFLTPIGKKTKEDYYYQAKSQYQGMPLKGDLSLTMAVYFTNPASDLDNAAKGLIDAMKGILWVDDRQIVEIHAFKKIDKVNPRVELSALLITLER